MKCLRLCFLIVLLAACASADVIYSNQSAFNAATKDVTLQNFNGLTPFQQHMAPAFSLAGIDYFNPGGSYLIGVQTTYDAQGSQEYLDFEIPSNLLITLHGSYTAAAMNLGTFWAEQNHFTIFLSNGSSFHFTTTGLLTQNFFGVTTDQSFEWIRIVGGEPYAALDNLQYGTDLVPEPMSLALLGTGLVGLSWRLRKAKGVSSF